MAKRSRVTLTTSKRSVTAATRFERSAGLKNPLLISNKRLRWRRDTSIAFII